MQYNKEILIDAIQRLLGVSFNQFPDDPLCRELAQVVGVSWLFGELHLVIVYQDDIKHPSDAYVLPYSDLPMSFLRQVQNRGVPRTVWSVPRF